MMIFPILRIIIGLFFLIVSTDKLLQPYQNFLYIVQNYQLFPPFLEEIVARVVPWIEFFLGLFLILGLWSKRALQGLAALLMGFLCVVGQAMVRGLPLDKCGCFGDLISIPLHGIFIFDSTMLVFTVMMLRRIEPTSRWGLDEYFPEAK